MHGITDISQTVKSKRPNPWALLSLAATASTLLPVALVAPSPKSCSRSRSSLEVCWTPMMDSFLLTCPTSCASWLALDLGAPLIPDWRSATSILASATLCTIKFTSCDTNNLIKLTKNFKLFIDDLRVVVLRCEKMRKGEKKITGFLSGTLLKSKLLVLPKMNAF